MMYGRPHRLRAGPDGTRVGGQTRDGVTGVATSGPGTPAAFVSQRNQAMAGDSEREDDDTPLFALATCIRRPGTRVDDVCRQVRGGTRVNLTDGTSTHREFVNVR